MFKEPSFTAKDFSQIFSKQQTRIQNLLQAVVYIVEKKLLSIHDP